MMAYMDNGLINSLPSTTDWLSKRKKNALKKHTDSYGWLKENHTDLKRLPKIHLQQLLTRNVSIYDEENTNGIH